MKSIAFAAMLLATNLMAHANPTQSQDSCTIYGPNVCKEATLLQASLEDVLPLSVSEMLTMEKVAANHNELVILVRVHGEEGKKLRNAIATDPDHGIALKTATQDSLFRKSCSGDQVNAFISNGGKVTYQLLHEDNAQMMKVSIMSCTQPLGDAA
ncbi:hypothetical protein P5704_027915 (plasmid) [Pseudomonas sp. FeN3W]|nr:hypothetical protein P5704_027915 [Pseudomonas sp. FeN3W]